MDYDTDLVIDEEYECSICGQDIFESNTCDHWPGQTYLINGEEVLCQTLIHKQKIG